jgi:hypothetical protein
MTTKKTPAKPAPAKKPGPPQVTDEKVAEWRAYAKRLAKRAAPYDLDLDDIEKRIIDIEQRIPQTPPVIHSAAECTQHQSYLRRLCHLRNKLTQIQSRCIQSKAVWGHVIKMVKGYLWTQAEVVALKNDTARTTVTRRVIGRLEWNYTLVSSLIEAADKINWTIKDNQRAVLGMIQTASEERFLYQQGMEK